jgi:hypothetical protein
MLDEAEYVYSAQLCTTHHHMNPTPEDPEILVGCGEPLSSTRQLNRKGDLKMLATIESEYHYIM